MIMLMNSWTPLRTDEGFDFRVRPYLQRCDLSPARARLREGVAGSPFNPFTLS